MTSTSLISQNVEFQVTDWSASSKEVDLGDEQDVTVMYVIRMFGITKTGQKVFVVVNGCTPYFYVKIPEYWNTNKIKILLSAIKGTVDGFDSKSDQPAVANSLKEWAIEEKHIFKEFTNYKLFKFIKLTFYSYEGFRAYQRAFNRKITNPLLSKQGQYYEAFETNIDPMLRFMHTQNLNSMGMIKISKYTTLQNNISTDEIAIETDYKNVLPILEDKSINKLVIASFDLECTSCDGNFPQANRDGDKIIQIGTTFNRYGEDECFMKHIITLNTCDDIEGVEVVQCATEKELLLEWTKLIIRTNPDIITGYNIYLFDMPYLEGRARKLGCLSAFSKLGRIKNIPSPYIEKDLSSAALGKNILHYFQMEGRVTIDVMKVVQRDHKLGSYKLDNVAADFIRDEITYLDVGDNNELITAENCNELSRKEMKYDCSHSTKNIIPDEVNNTTTIYTKGIYGLEVNRYIKICFNDGLSDNSYKNDAKFKVLKINPKSITIGKEIYDTITIDGILSDEALMLDKYTIYWSQAKDDVSAHDIFRMQEQGPKERAIIARYCIQDCVLVNKLINKLQIVTSNCAMANVCSVPFSYIFLRGQGIKCLSVVAKKCVQRNHLIPIIKRPFVDKKKLREENAKKTKAQLKADKEADELLYGFEGAAVLEPKTGVYFDDPITVLDYNSLYPNSMIAYNFSHECKVTDQAYANLPDYYYEDVTYNNKDGTTKTCTFARPKNSTKLKGVLIEVLTDLLNARAYTRELQKTETDPFKWKILESLQLAYKITANSIYGNTGARTSSIYDKDIAACTTTIGRKMLHVAKIFTELLFGQLINIIQKDDKKGYEKFMEMLFDKQIDELIGEKNIEDLQNDPEGERYSYLEVMKNNKTPIEPKFVNGKLGHKCRSDFLKWFYDNIKKQVEEYGITPNIIYGDTDSIFINFKIRKNGEIIDGMTALAISIQLGILCSSLFHKLIPDPELLAYEKTLYPFAILSKKRYFANKYEFKTDHYEQISMGILLKRRDSAPITKLVYGGIVRSILEDKSAEKAVEFVKETLRNIFRGKYRVDKFIMSKTLKGPAMNRVERKIEQKKHKEDRYYADRTRMAHCALADRMADRDKGSAPQSNDRVPFVYVITENEVVVQGDRVESPEYILENNLEIDYVFYITNQIFNPCVQILTHLISNPEKLFETCIMIEINRRTGKRPLKYYFKLLQELADARKVDPFENSDDEDEDDEDGENNELKTFNNQFIKNFEDDTTKLGDKKSLVHRNTKRSVAPKSVPTPGKKNQVPIKKDISPTKKVINKKTEPIIKDLTPDQKDPVSIKRVVQKKTAPIKKKGKGVNVDKKVINNDGGFSL